MVVRGSERARLVWFRAGDNRRRWFEDRPLCPLAAEDREWVPAGVVSHEEKLWWFDFSWGILSCDPFAEEPKLLFHDPPEGRTLGMSRKDIHDHRCITESHHDLRYLEIVPDGEASTVSMWTGIPAPDDGDDEIIAWDMDYEVSFAEIWNDDSYRATGLPQKVSVLAVVCSSNPDVVYFALEQEERLFGVDVPVHRVVEFVDVALGLVMPWPAPACCRYVLTWFLPPSVATALGIEATDSEDDATEGSTDSEDDATEGSL